MFSWPVLTVAIRVYLTLCDFEWCLEVILLVLERTLLSQSPSPLLNAFAAKLERKWEQSDAGQVAHENFKGYITAINVPRVALS